jgi:hypothetical protein
MLLVGYCLGIRSERRLCEEVHLTLAYPLGFWPRIPETGETGRFSSLVLPQALWFFNQNPLT